MLRKAAADCGVDPRAVTVSVVALDGLRMPEGGRMPVVRPLLAVNADRSVAPASTAKLVTTLAGLELLGADWKWRTGFYAKARPDAEGRVNGIWLRGGGDPTLVAEKFGLLVERMAQMGVRRIEGDLTVDRSYFDLPEGDPSAFDGRGSRPYNQLPDAAVAGYRSLSFELVPDESSGTARIISMPPLSGLEVPSTIRLSRGACGDWKSTIGYRLEHLSDGRLAARFEGSLPLSCGPKTFSVVSLSQNEYLERLFRWYWERDGRTWTGHVAEGRVPEGALKLAERESDALPVVTTLVNKWSNNLIARHIFLTLGTLRNAPDEADSGSRTAGGAFAPMERPRPGVDTDDARAVLAGWLAEKGVPTHFVEELSERETVVKKVTIVPLEVIIRNISAGSFAKRYGVEEGIVFDQPTIEFSYKNDALGDPLLNTYHALALKLATAEEIETIKNDAFAVNEVLKAFWAECGVTLVDFKLEFGKVADGSIVLADEISPDTCRLWDAKTHEKLDKDRFRRDLGGVEDAYAEIMKRLLDHDAQ